MSRYIFRADKMLFRCEADPEKAKLLDDETVRFIHAIDGEEGTDYNWQNVVNGEPVVYLLRSKVPVAIVDCDPA